MTTISAEEREYTQELKKKTAMPMILLGMGSIVMIFAALTSAVIVSKSSRDWVNIEIPSTFLFSTIVIIISSLSYWWAYRSAKKGQFSMLKNGVMITLILGLVFTFLQFSAWNELTRNGVFFAGPSSTVSGSYFYVLTGLHLAHLIGGLISLSVVYYKSARGFYSSNKLLGLQVSTTYWHFLSVLWVYLYIFLNFIA